MPFDGEQQKRDVTPIFLDLLFELPSLPHIPGITWWSPNQVLTKFDSTKLFGMSSWLPLSRTYFHDASTQDVVKKVETSAITTTVGLKFPLSRASHPTLVATCLGFFVFVGFFFYRILWTSSNRRTLTQHLCENINVCRMESNTWNGAHLAHSRMLWQRFCCVVSVN